MPKAMKAVKAMKARKATSNYDKLISSKLNESKCQLYMTAAMEAEDVVDILPQATRTRRPWSLGFALPVRNAVAGEDDICEAEMKCEARMQVAKQTALKAKVLPHDMRVRVLATVHASQWQHGREFCKLKAADGNRLLRDLEESLWGTTNHQPSCGLFFTKDIARGQKVYVQTGASKSSGPWQNIAMKLPRIHSWNFGRITMLEMKIQ